MSEQRLYILCGLPYSGKTTLTKKFVQMFGFDVVSVDQQIEKYGMDTDVMSQEDWNLVYSDAYEDLKKKLKDSKTVVFDLGHLKRSERNTARAIAESLSVEHYLIYLNTPKKILELRWLENEKTKLRGQLSREGLHRAYEMWEEPTEDENPVFYNSHIDTNDWIDENFPNL